MSLTKRIIPCLDICNGRVVKGVNFINIKDAGDPVKTAINYNKQGADEIIVLNITASNENHKIMVQTVKNVANNVFIPLTVGGGIKNLKDIKDMLAAGADKVAINSAAINNPNLIFEASKHFGSQCIVLAIDAKQITTKPAKWNVFINGGRKATNIDAIEWAIKMTKNNKGAGEILLTSIDRDGTKNGFDIELTRTISQNTSVPVIASGGAGNLEHLSAGILQGGADAVLGASIFHFNEYTIRGAKLAMQKKGIDVRL